MRDTHGLDGRRDGPGIDERNILADAAEGHVRAERLSVERDLATRQLRTHPLPESEHRRGACADAEPNDTWLATGRESTGMVDLDVECGDATRGRFGRVGHVSQP